MSQSGLKKVEGHNDPDDYVSIESGELATPTGYIDHCTVHVVLSSGEAEGCLVVELCS